MWPVFGFVLLTLVVTFILNKFLFNPVCVTCQRAEAARRAAQSKVLEETKDSSEEDLLYGY